MLCIFQVAGKWRWEVSGKRTWEISKGPCCLGANFLEG